MHSSSPRLSRNRQFESDDLIYEENYLATLCRRPDGSQQTENDNVDCVGEAVGYHDDDTNADFSARNTYKGDYDDSDIRGGAENALPAIPEFNPLTHHPHLFRRKGQVTLPPALELGHVNPLLLFTQFFPAPVLETIVQNTNSYASIKLRHVRDSNPDITPRKWKQLTVAELKEWIAIVIYMGLHRESAVEKYWNKDPGLPTHPIADRISLFRFQQIKRFLHVADPSTPSPAKKSLHKIKPLTDHIEATSRRLYIPSSNVCLDEMIVGFGNRSGHTVRKKKKPIPEGYTILSLCDSGYVYTFMMTSQNQRIEEVPEVPGINQTGCNVLHLINRLPLQIAKNVFLDYNFTSIPLFQKLREMRIGACGPSGSKRTKLPTELKVQKTDKLDSKILNGIIVDEVLLVPWMDNWPLYMLTTIHGFGDDSRAEQARENTQEASPNTLKALDEAYTESVRIHKVIDDYNTHMSGVAIADQLRGYYNTQLAVRGTWMPMLFWCLDTAIVNSYILMKLKSGDGFQDSPQEFRLKLVFDLLREVDEEMTRDIDGGRRSKRRNIENEEPPRKKVLTHYVTKNYELPDVRFQTGQHFPDFGKRTGCQWCKIVGRKNGVYDGRHPTQSETYCKLCKVYLCYNKSRNCFLKWHTENP